MRRLRVCVACLDPFTFGGGTASCTWAMLEALDRLGYEATLLFVSPQRKFTLRKKVYRENGRSVISIGYLPSFPFIANAFAGLTVKRELRSFDIYQVVGGGAMAAAMFWVNALRYIVWMGPTLKDEIQGSPWWEDLKIGNLMVAAIKALAGPSLLIEQRVLRGADRVLVQSPRAVEAVPEQYKLPREKVDWLPFPVDTEKFSPGKLAEGPDFSYILSVGRVDDARKNFPLLIRAFRRVKSAMPHLKLVIVGKLSDKSRMRNFVQELGLDRDVVFTGQVQKVEEYHRQAIVFVQPSRQEGLGIAILEAMASGTPVVATRCGGPEGFIQHGKTGLLVRQDEADLSEAILRVLRDNDLRKQLSINARSYILKNHTQEIFCTKLQQVYQEVYREVI